MVKQTMEKMITMTFFECKTIQRQRSAHMEKEGERCDTREGANCIRKTLRGAAVKITLLTLQHGESL